jgi:hypothetical protein
MVALDDRYWCGAGKALWRTADSGASMPIGRIRSRRI